MKTFLISSVVLLLCFANLHAKSSESCENGKKPKNVVIIMADDLGFHDISLRGSNQIPTPNIDALAYNGILMNRFYTPPLCTPSRASLLTGRYPFHIGLQNNVAWNDQPYGLGMDQKLMSEYFKEAGYSTHLVGKWHLGFYREQYTPTRRGFDTYHGFYSPWTDYYSSTFYMGDRNYSRGLDLRRNLVVDRNQNGQYATDMYTQDVIDIIENHDKDKPMFLLLTHLAPHAGNDDDPLQAKPEDIAKFAHITAPQPPQRQVYAAMVHALDESIGKIVESLTNSGLMEDTILVFYSDNGGPTPLVFKLLHPTTANNYPLKGIKGWAHEGGIRTDCVIYAPFLPSGVIRNDLFHVTDFLPTLASLAEADVYIDRKIDGVDQSKMIKKGKHSNRNEVVTIDDIYGVSSMIKNNWKYVNGTYVPFNGRADNWFGQNNNFDYQQDQYVNWILNSKTAKSLSKFNKLDSDTIETLRSGAAVTCLGIKTPCSLMVEDCLYDIDNDPCEENNLARDPAYASVLQKLRTEFNAKKALVAPALNQIPDDPTCDPAFYGGVWTSYYPDTSVVQQTSFGEYAVVYPKKKNKKKD